MKKLIIAALCVATMFASCSTENRGVTTTISGRFVGSNVDSVFLERVSDSYTTVERVAAASLADNGAFSFEFEMDESSPRFYRLSFPENRRPVMLVVAAGDNIELESVGDIFLNYEVEGSEESALIREFNRSYFVAGDRLAGIAENTLNSSRLMDRELSAYTAAREAITAQVSFVGAHQDRLAAFYALHQNVAESYIPQLMGYGITTAHRQSLLAGLSKSYPDSPYLAVLQKEIDEDIAYAELASNVSLASFPDIELQDMFKQTHRLSDYEGKVVLLYFWSATDAMCNNLNAELKSVYDKYHDRGFEVFQVSADSDMSLWISAVRQQKLPWVSLFGGNEHSVFSLYNVRQLPTLFLIDREGNMSVCPMNINSLAADIEKML